MFLNRKDTPFFREILLIFTLENKAIMEGHVSKHKIMHAIVRWFLWMTLIAVIGGLINKFFEWYKTTTARNKTVAWIVGIILCIIMAGICNDQVEQQQAFNNRWNERTWTSGNSRDLQTRDSLERLGLKDEYSK